MEHNFNIEVAKELGVNAAVIYNNIKYWCEKNRANCHNFHDGNYWTYNSKNALMELFPYMTYSQIKTALSVLVDAKYIGKGNFNENPYDRTNWYCDLHQKHGLNTNQSTGDTSPIERSLVANRLAIESQCITDSKPYSKPNNKTINRGYTFDDFLNMFNKTVSLNGRVRNFKKTKKVEAQFNARIKDGYNEDDFLKAVKGAMKNDFHVKNNLMYLTPEFFTRAEKIEMYKNQFQEEKTSNQTQLDLNNEYSRDNFYAAFND